MMMTHAKTLVKLNARKNMAFLNQILLYLVEVVVVTLEKHFTVWNKLIIREKPIK